MTYKIIAFIIISCLAGIKKPLYGGIAGMLIAPILSVVHMSFDLPTIFMLAPFGFGFGLLIGVISWNIFNGSEYNQQNKKTYYMPMTRNMRGGIVHTDEEAKNAKENKNKIT